MRRRDNLGRLPAARILLAILPVLLAAGCSSHRSSDPTTSLGRPIQSGMASWYGPGFQGRRTANGEKYNMYDLTAAHPTLPFGTHLMVRNVRTGQTVVVRVNDRGPFKKKRILDLSYTAAREVGVFGPGTAYVEIYPAGRAEAPQPELVPHVVLAASSVPSRYTVQVGAFSETGRAVQLHREIARIYPEVFVHSDGTWNRVQVGLFNNRDQAESLRRELAVLGLSSVVVTTR